MKLFLFNWKIEDVRAKADENPQYRFYLAKFYYLGEGGVKEDKEKAFSLFLSAAQDGYSEAFVMSAKCFLHGIGVKQDEKEAIKWFNKAIKAGDSDGLYGLAKCYLKGKGVEVDQDKAINLLESAANDFYNIDAMYLLYTIYKEKEENLYKKLKEINYSKLN